RFDRVLVGKITRQNMDAIAHCGGDNIKRIFAGAGDRDDRALGMQSTRDRAADRSARTGYQHRLAGQIEHHRLLPALKAAMSSGLLIAVVVAPSASRLINPLSTLPAPTS